jgi:hypothetical protein
MEVLEDIGFTALAGEVVVLVEALIEVINKLVAEAVLVAIQVMVALVVTHIAILPPQVLQVVEAVAEAAVAV